MVDRDGEDFRRFALETHVRGLVKLCRERQTLTRKIRLAAADAVAWAFRLRDDLLSDWDGYPEGFKNGATWARHRITHGDAHLLTLAPSSEIDGSFDSSDILFNDPELTPDGRLPAEGWTVRFAAVEQPIGGDRRNELRLDYNRHVAGRRVVVVCGLLAGRRTLGNPFVSTS